MVAVKVEMPMVMVPLLMKIAMLERIAFILMPTNIVMFYNPAVMEFWTMTML